MNKVRQFLIETRDLLKKVTWPDKKTLTRLTAVVLLVSIGVGILLSGADLVFTQIIGIMIK